MKIGAMEFDGHDLSPYVRAYPQRSIMPDASPKLVDVGGREGQRLQSVHYDPLQIDVVLRFLGKDLTETRRYLASVFDVDKPCPLRFYDEPRRFYLALPVGASSIDEMSDAGKASMSFICPDPVAYGDTAHAHVSGTKRIFVDGTRKTTPVFVARVENPQVPYRITNMTTGELIQVQPPFASGAELRIDCTRELVTVGGESADDRLTLKSDFFALQVGENVLTTTNGSVYVEWVERWI